MGGVLGIIVWEIARGNPYGLVVLTFFLMMPLYYLFFTSQVLNIVAIMTKVTLLLVNIAITILNQVLYLVYIFCIYYFFQKNRLSVTNINTL